MTELDGPRSVGRLVRQLLDRVDRDTVEALGDVADLLIKSLRRGGLVYVAGSGHSLTMVCETFYRAGGLAAVRPLWHPDLLPLSDALRSTRAERTPGLGTRVVGELNPSAEDVVVVFSTSGSNPYPIDVAKACERRGIPVIAVTSRTAAAGATARAETLLTDHADIVLDTAVPPGDSVYPGSDPRTSAVSTLNASYIWAMLLAELDVRAHDQGFELPRWRSANVPDGDRENKALFDRYGPHIPELGQ
ncbi:MAG: sugar isomerase domain-containing protein [Nocardioidaceae bacterium]